MKKESLYTLLLFLVIGSTLFYQIDRVTKSKEKHSYYTKESNINNFIPGDLLITYKEKVISFALYKGKINDSTVLVYKGKDPKLIKWEDIVELLGPRYSYHINKKKDNCFCEVLWANQIIENPVLFDNQLTALNISGLKSLETNEKLITIGSDPNKINSTGIWGFVGIFFTFFFTFCIFIINKIAKHYNLHRSWSYVGLILLSILLAYDQYNSSSTIIIWLQFIKYLLIIGSILGLINQIKKMERFKNIPIFYLSFTIIIFVIGMAFEFTLLPVLSEILKLIDTNAFYQYTIENSEKEQFIFWSSFSLAYLIYNFFKFLNRDALDYNTQINNTLLASSTLASIQSRINPHFLYNALNSIASLAHTEPKKTEEMALQLAKFYEQCSDLKSKPMITLAEECDILKSYLKIEKIRFGDRLQVLLQIDHDAQDILIPSFTLQPIVENAIKYGYNPVENVITIRITAETNDKGLILRIYDSGPSFSDEMNSGYGLSSISKKLKVLFPERHTISFINEPEKCVEVVLY